MIKLLFLLPMILLIISFTPQVFAQYEDTVVVLETEMGRLIIEFFPDAAPNHVENFITLSENGVYKGTIFHRIIEDFMIQGGDPKSADPTYPMSEWGTGDPGYSIDAEFNNIEHKRGIVSMARSSDPNSAGSQFFIVHKDSNFLDGQYTVFGRIMTDESFQTLDLIASLDTTPNDLPIDSWKAMVKQVLVIDRSEIADLPESTPPTINNNPIFEAPTQNQTHDFPQFGLSFTSPAGYLVQTPTAISRTTPDIVIVGSKTETANPAISIKIAAEPKSLEQSIGDVRTTVAPLIDSGALTLSSEHGTQINGHNAYIINAIGHFEDRDGIEQKVGFSSMIIKVDNLLYTIQYSNDLRSYEKNLRDFTLVVESMQFSDIVNVKAETGATSTEGGYDGTLLDTEETPEGGGCLIATAAYGSEMAPQVQFLREIRDGKVMTTQSGTTFMTGFNQFYYSFSPAVADYERENPVFKEVVKVTLTPMLTSLTLLNYVDVDSEQEILGYGIGIILLNIGMYFVAPAAAIIAIKNRLKKCHN